MRHYVLIALLLTACDGKSGDETKPEGTNPGECSDGADNDSDGDYDCDDSDCAGAPDCDTTDSDSDGTPDADDCAPNDPAVHPGADELCNEVDDDCDGEVDNNPIDSNTYYGDADGDGHYGDADTVSACAIPDGYGFEPLDCDDTNPAVYPGADEACDLTDSDCDGALGSHELDADGDGFAACEECDDTRSTAYPGADEACNDLDDDCDGSTDEDAS